mgnify:CR=1 FL=1
MIWNRIFNYTMLVLLILMAILGYFTDTIENYQYILVVIFLIMAWIIIMIQKSHIRIQKEHIDLLDRIIKR